MKKSNNKLWLWVLVVVIIAVIVFIVVKWTGYGNISNNAPIKATDTTSVITGDLNSIDLGTPENDVKQLDNNINKLK